MRIVSISLLFLPYFFAWGTEINIDKKGTDVQLEADILELAQTQQSVHAKGNAIINQGDITITARELTAFYNTTKSNNNTIDISSPSVQSSDTIDTQETENAEKKVNISSQKIKRIEAHGNVEIKNKQQHASAEKAVYDCIAETLVLTGNNLKLVINPTTIVTADETLEYWQKQNVGVAQGNAAVYLEKGRKLLAPRLLAYFTYDSAKKLKLSKISADSNVVIESLTEKITSKEGIFDAEQEVIILIGNVTIQRGKNKITGDRAEVNLRTGISRLVGKKNQRVRAEIVPDDKMKKQLTIALSSS